MKARSSRCASSTIPLPDPQHVSTGIAWYAHPDEARRGGSRRSGICGTAAGGDAARPRVGSGCGGGLRGMGAEPFCLSETLGQTTALLDMGAGAGTATLAARLRAQLPGAEVTRGSILRCSRRSAARRTPSRPCCRRSNPPVCRCTICCAVRRGCSWSSTTASMRRRCAQSPGRNESCGERNEKGPLYEEGAVCAPRRLGEKNEGTDRDVRPAPNIIW